MCGYLTYKLEVQKAVSMLSLPRHFCFFGRSHSIVYSWTLSTQLSVARILNLPRAWRLLFAYLFSPFPAPATFSYAVKGCWESTKSAGFWEKVRSGSFSRRSLRVLTDEWP